METLKVAGTRVKGHGHQRYKTCDRCGRDVVRDRNRADGLVLCISCVSDKWWIKKVTGKS